MYGLLVVLIVSLVWFIRFLNQRRQVADLGRYLFHSKKTPFQIAGIILLIVLYAILFYLYTKHPIYPFYISFFTLLIPAIWIVVLLWPDSVYEKGFVCTGSVIKASDIEKIEKRDEGTYVLSMRKGVSSIFGSRTVKIPESKEIPFIDKIGCV